MFTGLIEDLGRLESIERNAEGAVLRISTQLAGGLGEGDSIAVDGVCLTAASVDDGSFTAQAMNQTLSLSTLAAAEPGATLNLELAARLGDHLGGHIVQGHVDGLAEVTGVVADGLAQRMRVRLPDGLERYVVEHGSVALNGVSLTVAAIDGAEAEVSLVPETCKRTNLGNAGPGDRLNLECDLIARHLEKLASSGSGREGPGNPR